MNVFFKNNRTCFILFLMFLFFFLSFSQSIECSEVYPWQMECLPSNYANKEWALLHCLPNNFWDQPCEVFDEIECTGNRTFTVKRWCPNSKGKNYSLAVILSFLGGIFGIDRFYLGYPSIGFMKMFTFGFFFVGYIVDIVLISTQRVVPKNGLYISSPFPIIAKYSHPDIV